MKKITKIACAIILCLCTVLGQGVVCINSAWNYNNNSNGKWAWYSLSGPSAHAYAGWMGTTPKTVTLVTSYVSNNIQVVYDSRTVTNTTAVATGITVPICGPISKITATVHVSGETAIAECLYENDK